MPGERVVCDRCGWRTVRVYMSCECDCEYGCHCGPRVGYGTCNKCRNWMRTPADIRAEAKFYESIGRRTKTDPFFGFPQGVPDDLHGALADLYSRILTAILDAAMCLQERQPDGVACRYGDADWSVVVNRLGAGFSLRVDDHASGWWAVLEWDGVGEFRGHAAPGHHPSAVVDWHALRMSAGLGAARLHWMVRGSADGWTAPEGIVYDFSHPLLWTLRQILESELVPQEGARLTSGDTPG